AISPVAGVAGFVFPGDRVDVIVTHTIGRKSDTESSDRRVSETMIKNVRVLALDQKMNDQVVEPKVAQVATLEVTPKQAETMALITQIGSVSLALRSIAADPEAAKNGESETETTATMMPSHQQPAVAPDVALDAAALAAGAPALPSAGDTLTWDSDVSKVLPQPANRTGATQKIQIIRGKETTESIFDLPQQ
ncbi:MAG TPA: Flp pilus assembly protein CpaB, partial [Rhodospirillaceae bacterium]|nr:Flp pilus assembly protein CpaB [Rhodospirillaceae bacterium]